MRPILFFDLETTARPEAVATLPEPEPPANYKDPAKIAAYLAEKRAAQLEKAALDPDTAQVTAIAVQFYPVMDSPQAQLVGDTDTTDEKALLQWFWEMLAGGAGRSAGYCVINFDFPMLQRRSLALGVRPSCVPMLRRYQTDPITDLMEILFQWGAAGPYKGLKTVAALYGLHNPCPQLNGAQVATMEKEILRAYVANDVNLAVQLWKRMDGIYWPAQQVNSQLASCVNPASFQMMVCYV